MQIRAPNYQCLSNSLYHLTYHQPTNSLWIGTRFGGLTNFNISTNTFVNYGIINGLIDNVIDDVDVDNNGNVWIACRYFGVAKFDGSSFTYYTTLNGLQGNDIYSITVAPNGYIWAGCTTGLSVFNGNVWSNFNSTNSALTGEYIRQIEFKNNYAWLATGGGGIQKFDGANEWTSYLTTNSNIANDSIWSVYIDDSKTVWAASYGRGLLKMLEDNRVDDSLNVRITVYPDVIPTSINSKESVKTKTMSNFYQNYLQLNSIENNSQLKVYNTLGQIIYNEKITSNRIDLNSLERGIYITEISTNSQIIETKKIIKFD
jgi:streptogramin lyase